MVLLGLLACCHLAVAQHRSSPNQADALFVISRPQDVEDVALLDREFGAWNFGSAILLDAGYMPGLYEVHHGVSLIRFNLSGLDCDRVQSATLRLYKPRCSIQMTPVQVELYQVAPENRAWCEGAAECASAPDASTWKGLKRGQPWAGASGCSRAGVDYLDTALDVQTAPLNSGPWMEFGLPPRLVQTWIDAPQTNAGLYLKARHHGEKLGEHVYFHASEHHSGKGPQLVIKGSGGASKTERIHRPYNKRYVFPERNEPFQRWLATADNRYTGWVESCRMSKEQAILPYYWEVIIRGEFLQPRCRLRLMQGLTRLDDLIAQGNEAAVRQELEKVREYLLVWEYIRETRWYDSGPLADELSPLQLGILWGQEIFGKMLNKYGNSSWKRLSPQELEQAIRETVEKTRERLELTPEQAAQVDPVVAENERLEHFYVERFMSTLEEIQGRIARGEDDERMLDCVRRLHFDHELFLYHQSTFNTPRWTAFMAHAQAIPLAKMYLKARRKEYNAARIGRNREHALKYGRQDRHTHWLLSCSCSASEANGARNRNRKQMRASTNWTSYS